MAFADAWMLCLAKHNASEVNSEDLPWGCLRFKAQVVVGFWREGAGGRVEGGRLEGRRAAERHTTDHARRRGGEERE